MSTKKIWSGVLPLGILVSFIVAILLLAKIGRNDDERIIKDGIDGEGTVSDEGNRMIRIHYTANGESYSKGVGKPFSGIEDGEVFKIKYLPSDPSNLVVFFDQPMLDKHEYRTTECLSIRKSFSVVDFEYRVDGRVIKRRTLFDNHSPTAAAYLVKYRIENDQIGYLIKKK